MTKRATPIPPKQGSRSPEEIQEAVREVMQKRSVADWERVAKFSRMADQDEGEDTPESPPLTSLPPSARINSVKKRILLAPATVSPRRDAIRAAVEKVAERRRLEAEKSAAGDAVSSRPRKSPSKE
jgi:hypothetical protein